MKKHMLPLAPEALEREFIRYVAARTKHKGPKVRLRVLARMERMRGEIEAMRERVRPRTEGIL